MKMDFTSVTMVLFGFIFISNSALAEEGCFYALSRYEQAASTETAKARDQALKTCDSPSHRHIPALQKQLHECRDQGSQSKLARIENCEIGVYIVNQRVEYPGSLHEDGAICLAAYVPFFDEQKHLSLAIDGSTIEMQWEGPRLIVTGLDLNKSHEVNIFYDSKKVESWMVSFIKRKATMVDIWRSPGYWHLESNLTGKCQSR